MLKSRRGVSLAELLGAIVLFTLITALLAGITFAMLSAVRRITVAEKANAMGLLIQHDLENAMEDARATAYVSCVGVSACVVLENHYEYVYNDVTTMVDVTVHDPALTTRIAIENSALWIGATAVEDGVFTIGNASTLTVTDVSGAVTVTIVFVLVAADGSTFSFTASHAFLTSSVPV